MTSDQWMLLVVVLGAVGGLFTFGLIGVFAYPWYRYD